MDDCKVKPTVEQMDNNSETKNGNGKLSLEIMPQQKGDKDVVKSYWNINKKTLPYKLNFFLFCGGMGAILPYLTAFGINVLRLTATNISAAFGVQQFVFIILKPVVGFLADYFNRLKAMLVILTVMQAVFFFLMIVIPEVDVHDRAVNFQSSLIAKPSSLSNCHSYHNHLSLENILDGTFVKYRINCTLNLKKSEELDTLTCDLKNLGSRGDVEDEVLDASFTNATQGISLPSEKVCVSVFLNTSDCSNFICIQDKNASFIESHSLVLRTESCYVLSELQSFRFSVPFSDDAQGHGNSSCESHQPQVPAFKADHSLLLTSYVFKTYQYWLFTIFLALSSICVSSIFTMYDTACYEAIQDLGSDYGRTRCWGAFSWAIAAPLAGFFNDYTEHYFASWCLMAVMCTLQIWNLKRINLVKPDFSNRVFKDMKIVFKSFEFVAFVIGVWMNGILTGIIWFYLTLFLISIGGNKFIVGLAQAVQCFVGEIPFMFCSNWVIEKVGHFNIVSLALFGHGLRFLCYSYIYNPLIVLPVEVLHGFTFAIFYPAMTSYAKLNAKPGTEVTTQSILSTTYEAFGTGFGCVIFGACFDRLGGHSAFFYAAFFAMFATIINVGFTVLLQYRKGVLDVIPKDRERY